MKTRNKILALLEIVIVLCSVFLVALPAIAAQEQNQAMQKVSASTNMITTASEDDYILGIYGNANEDDAIDMRDLTYVKLIFFGKKPETELADAKYDGKINPLDFIQIKLIIVGKEKEITLIDGAERIVTVKKPVKRIIVTFRQAQEMIRSIKVETDRIVGVESLVQSSGGPPYGVNYKIFFPEFSDLPSVGLIWKPDCEAILSLHPDVVLLIAKHWSAGDPTLNNAQNVLESAGITVIRVYGCVWGKEILEETRKLGYIFDKSEEAEEFLDWYEGILNPIKERVEKIPEEDKPEVYLESSNSYSTVAGGDYQDVEAAGGKNIFFEMGGSGSVDPEAVIDRNPDIIVKVAPAGEVTGYHLDSDDTTEIEKVREEIMSRPELQNVKAVKTGRVYVISNYIIPWGAGSGCRGFLQNLYMAKWFHPELFDDLNPQAIHQEYLVRFQGLDIDLDEKGVFVYPPFED